MIVAAASATVGIGVALRAEGIALTPSVKPGQYKGTCTLPQASAVIIVEEGTRNCRFYPFESQDEAKKCFERKSWRPFSRLMFHCHEGDVLEELQGGGPHLAHETIRRASRILALHDKIFVQENELGKASFHFITHEKAFVSYESRSCSSWCLDDAAGTPLERQKFFEETSYDPEKHIFRGVINWAPASFCGDQRWEYEMHFDPSLSVILDGCVHHFTPDVSDRNASQQMIRFSQDGDGDPGVTLRYARWRPQSDTALLAQTDIESRSEVCWSSQSHRESTAGGQGASRV